MQEGKCEASDDTQRDARESRMRVKKQEKVGEAVSLIGLDLGQNYTL